MDEFFVTFHLRITVPQVGKFVEVLVRSTIMGAQPVTAEVVNEGIGGDRAGNNGNLTTDLGFTGINETENNVSTNDPFNVINAYLTLSFIIKY